MKPTELGMTFYYLRAAKMPGVIPALIDRLSSDDQAKRANSYITLEGWTGQTIGHDWDPNITPYDRPTLDEGKKMQPLWRDCWEKNKATFVPKAG